MAVKGVVATVEDPETKESITVHVDTLVFSNPRLRDELDLEPIVPFDVPFRSVSDSYLPNLLGERPWTNLFCLRLLQYMPLPQRPAR